MIIGFALKKRELRILVGADDDGNLMGRSLADTNTNVIRMALSDLANALMNVLRL